MTNEQNATHEQISALADGQLQGGDFARTLQWLATDRQAQATWHAYHLIGDVLRSDDLVHGSAPTAFLARFQQRLAQEPPIAHSAARPAAQITLPTPPAAIEPIALPPTSTTVPGAQPVAANAPVWGWKALATAASVVAVAAVGWNMLGSAQLARPGTAGTLAANTAPAAAALPVTVATMSPELAAASHNMGDVPVMIRDPRLDSLLAAHKQFGGISALQMPAGFLRNATYEEPVRR